jgi:hypothetical protein
LLGLRFSECRLRNPESRLRAPTRSERTEAIALVLDAIAQDVGPENVSESLRFIGSQPSAIR